LGDGLKLLLLCVRQTVHSLLPELCPYDPKDKAAANVKQAIGVAEQHLNVAPLLDIEDPRFAASSKANAL
jgi:hypothetical protein